MTAAHDLEMDASRHDIRVHTAAALGKMDWQEVTGYDRRALVEMTMGFKVLSDIDCVRTTAQVAVRKRR